MMKQYMDIKKDHKDCILFFRLGDFYEMFFEDAIIASRELEITLTKRDGSGGKIDMCGVPHHVADSYIAKLVEKGYKVALCDQVEDPKEAKGLVKREVVKIISPGTIVDEKVLKGKSNNYLMMVYLDDFGVGISYIDNSTGEFYTTQFIGSEEESLAFSLNEIGKLLPSEIVAGRSILENKKLLRVINHNVGAYFSQYDKDFSDIKDNIFKKFQYIKGLEELEREDKLYSLIASLQILDYLSTMEKSNLEYISKLIYYESSKFMSLDFNTRRNLELTETIMTRSKKGSLLGFMDVTVTSMGGRLIKKWIEQPLLNIKEIETRQNVVGYLYENPMILDDLREGLNGVYDLDRLNRKITNGNCNGRDLNSLKLSLEKLPKIKINLIDSSNPELKKMGRSMDLLEDIYSLIDNAIVDDPPLSIREGRLIKYGYCKDLDEIKDISTRGIQWLKDLEEEEKEKTSIKNLKIGFNKISGYFFEVTKSNLSLVPDYFIRRQTLANSERYYTEELKSMEDKILNSKDRLLDLEYEVFTQVRDMVKESRFRIAATSEILSQLDVLSSFAKIAIENDYVKPELNTKGLIEIKDGRHPVVENNIDGHLFIANDSYMDLASNMVQIITGPNMSGKSTYMRQIAIITILAHIGAFVPASFASIAMTDRIFTRIGASDNLYQGESTFMVEMNEVANIIKTATRDSLIILDEVGRGTSTFDGLSIAWSIVEYIVDRIKAKTLFATHYHELTQLEKEFTEVKNLTITAEDKGGDIVFLRKIVPGSTNKSYGIEVAKLAGIDNKIINRAREVLADIESSHQIALDNDNSKSMTGQIDLKDYKKEILIDRLIEIDINNLSPIDAFKELNDLINTALKLRSE